MNLTVDSEESNFLRFYFLNLKVASKAVRVYFDSKYPPAKLAGELRKNEAHLKSLRFITSSQKIILYPGSGNIVRSDQFDTTLMICLLRNMLPFKVPYAPTTSWDDFPLSADTSNRADLARAKCYRNFVSHSTKVELSGTSQYWGDLEQAIGRLGGPPLLIEAQSAQHVILDTSLKDMLLELRNCEKSLQGMTDKINSHQSSLDRLSTKEEELVEKIHKMEAETQKLTTKLSDYKGTIDACTKELETCKNDIKTNKEIMKGLQNQSDKKENDIENLVTRIGKLEIKYEQHDKMIKEHGEHLVMHDGQVIQLQEHLVTHDGQLEKCEKQIHDIKEKQHDTDVTSVRSKQKRLEDDTKALIEEDIRERTFVTTMAVTDSLVLLKQNGVLLITGHAGTGKSRIGRHVLHRFCADNKSYKCIKLDTLVEWEDMVNREENMAVLIDDIFDVTNCNYNREKDTPILDKVYAYVCKGNIKVIITIRDTVKLQCQEVFHSHRLFKFNMFIDLSSDTYVLSREEKLTILTKYMKIVRQSDYTYSKGFLDFNSDTIFDEKEVEKIIQQNPVKGFPLVVYQFVHNGKYYHLGSNFFDRPTEIMLEDMNTIRQKGEVDRKFMIQYAVMVYTAIHNCINPDNNSCVAEVQEIIDVIYGETIKLQKWKVGDAVENLKCSYLVHVPNQRSYKLHHSTLQESVILSFAQVDDEQRKKMIPLISWSFFLKMVKPELYKKKEGEVVLVIPRDGYKILADRLVNIYMVEFLTYVYLGVDKFLGILCNTDIFNQDYSLLLPCLLKALEKEDDKDKHTENMKKSGELDRIDGCLAHMEIKEIFLVDLLQRCASLESQSHLYHCVFKTFKTITNTSGYYLTIYYMKCALISSLYEICSTSDLRSVEATLDMIEEYKIPVLLDQGIGLTDIQNTNFISTFGKTSYDETCVFLTLCIFKAYEVCNIPVLKFLLSKYIRNPFDINLFFKMIYKDEWIQNMTLLSFESLKWMIETFTDQTLDDPDLILRFACKCQMFDTVKYVASVCKTFDAISCLQAFVDKYKFFVLREIPFNQKLFDFLMKRIVITSKYLISVVKSVIMKRNVPDYMFDAFLPVCIDNADILTLACEYGQFVLVDLIIESSHIEQLDIQSALMAACKGSERKGWCYLEIADDEVEELKIVKYMVAKVGYEPFDLNALCQQACSSKSIKILKWLVQNIDLPRLDVYTIINSTIVNKRSDILEHIMNKIDIESLDKLKVLKSVTEHYAAECATTILEIVRTIWNSTEDKEVLQMEDIVNTAYERKCFELLAWIHENCHPHVSIDSKKVLMLACEDYRLDVAEWVLQTFEKKSLDIDGGELFMLACSSSCNLKYDIEKYQPEYNMMNEHWIEKKSSLICTVNWILATFQIQRLNIISGVLELITVDEKMKNEISNLVIFILEKYLSCLNDGDIKEMMNKSLEQKKYFLVNWFLEESGSCSFDKQMVLNKACTDNEIETIKILSKYFYNLDMTQAIIKACTLLSCFRYDILEEEEDYNADKSVACLNMLWNEVNKIDHDSIDIRTIVSTVCKEKNVRNNIMTWILLNLPLDQIPINEVLITCCQQSKIHHVKYILHKVAIDMLDIKKAFVKACRAFPGDFKFQFQNCKPQFEDELWQKERNKPKYFMIVYLLFQMQSEKDSSLKLVLNEMIENKKFDLMLYFLQSGYCRNINMKDLLKTSCRHGQVKLVQWIVANVEHKELDIKSAFHEACDGLNLYVGLYRNNVIPFLNQTLKHIECLALMWHHIHDINMFEIDTVLNKMTDTYASYSKYDLKTWLLYIKNINKGICQSHNALLNTEENINQSSQQI